MSSTLSQSCALFVYLWLYKRQDITLMKRNFQRMTLGYLTNSITSNLTSCRSVRWVYRSRRIQANPISI